MRCYVNVAIEVICSGYVWKCYKVLDLNEISTILVLNPNKVELFHPPLAMESLKIDKMIAVTKTKDFLATFG